LFGGKKPESPQLATPDLSRKFAEMVAQFFPAHPFLDGLSENAANVVFAADILVWALQTPAYQEAVRKALKLNPRLISGVFFDLYTEHLSQEDRPVLPLSDVGILYEAMKFQIGARQRASLEVIQEEEDEAKVTVYFDVIDRYELTDVDLVWLPIEPALLLASDATLRPKRPRIMTASDRVLAAARRAQLSRPSRAE
jgi:hypothetical protein